jgi:hypothetical protein
MRPTSLDAFLKDPVDFFLGYTRAARAKPDYPDFLLRHERMALALTKPKYLEGLVQLMRAAAYAVIVLVFSHVQ